MLLMTIRTRWAHGSGGGLYDSRPPSAERTFTNCLGPVKPLPSACYLALRASIHACYSLLLKSLYSPGGVLSIIILRKTYFLRIDEIRPRFLCNISKNGRALRPARAYLRGGSGLPRGIGADLRRGGEGVPRRRTGDEIFPFTRAGRNGTIKPVPLSRLSR